MSINKKYFCFNSVIPVREDHRDQSEMITQMLFGEVAELIEVHNQWIKISIVHDNYEGWVDNKQLVEIEEGEFEYWKKNPHRQAAYLIKWSSEKGVFTSLRGANTPNNSKFKVANLAFESVASYDNFTNRDISSIAMSYLNAPYLWGGRTNFGIDCSGFTQAVYRFFGINLPRDAYQQVELGKEVSFEERKIGDIAFFHNSKNKIIHVGILLENDKFIHASGRVRVDQLSDIGIINSENGNTTHNLTIIKRLLN
jgi:cell wall-associated NlpC family hydrolase